MPESGVPPTPFFLVAFSGNGSVQLRWIPSTGATSYNVYRGTTPGGENATPIVTGITGTTYNNTGLTNGTRYYYKVAAVNASGVSPLSWEASATPEISRRVRGPVRFWSDEEESRLEQ